MFFFCIFTNILKQFGKIFNPSDSVAPKSPLAQSFEAVPKSPLAQALEAVLGFPLVPSPLRPRDPGLAAMPCLRDPHNPKQFLALYTELDGCLTGLNLAERKINGTQWAQLARQFDFSRLEALNLRGNPLGRVAGLDQMRHLRYLDLCDTGLEQIDLPAGTAAPEHIFLYGNDRLSAPPPEEVARGRYSIIRFFQKIRDEGSSKLYEAKVLLLGSGGVGKTTLRRKLLDGIEASMDTKSTHGIEVEDMPFSCPETERFTAHLWDFGGQELYHATHQFFLTTRSLYLLVTDERKEDTNFAYWLQLIELLGGDSPVLIVQNERDNRSSDIGYKELAGLFGQVKAQHPLNLEGDTKKLAQLKEDIQTRLRHLDHVGADWPASRVAIRRDLEALRDKEPHISLDRYLELCAAQGQSEDDALDISRFLHDLGVALHFQDDPLLKKTVILDNQWAVGGVYQIVDDRRVQDKKGFFTQKMALRIWSDKAKTNYHPAHRRMADELLQLMLKFEICYLLEESAEKTYLAPQLLPKDMTDSASNWDTANNLQLRYEYDFMPKGLANRLIVRLHHYLSDPEADAWRAGAIFRYGERTALRLQEHWLNRQLQLHATGPQAKDLLTIVAAEIERLNNTYKRFRARPEAGKPHPVRKMVPCICSHCKNKEIPKFHDYEKLLRAKEAGRSAIECDAIFEQVSVSGLLEHIAGDLHGRMFHNAVLTPQLAERIRSFIAAGKIAEAVALLPASDDAAVQLQQRYHTLKNKYIGGGVSEDDHRTALNGISMAILDWCNPTAIPPQIHTHQ